MSGFLHAFVLVVLLKQLLDLLLCLLQPLTRLLLALLSRRESQPPRNAYNQREQGIDQPDVLVEQRALHPQGKRNE